LKVIGAGFGRTGTTSLKAALERLGFGPCYHMIEVFSRSDHGSFWLSAWRGERSDWTTVLGDYEACVDWPTCTFYEELMLEYPEAKVLLSVREPERWYESVRTTIYELSKTIDRSAMTRIIFMPISFVVFGGLSKNRGDLIEELIWQGTFHGRIEDRDYAMNILKQHNERVKRHVPPEKLLVYDVKQGWGPLCKFLGVPEPDEPFPHLNDTSTMQRGIKAIRILSTAVPVLALAGVISALIFLIRRSRN